MIMKNSLKREWNSTAQRAKPSFSFHQAIPRT